MKYQRLIAQCRLWPDPCDCCLHCEARPCPENDEGQGLSCHALLQYCRAVSLREGFFKLPRSVRYESLCEGSADKLRIVLTWQDEEAHCQPKFGYCEANGEVSSWVPPCSPNVGPLNMRIVTLLAFVSLSTQFRIGAELLHGLSPQFRIGAELLHG